MAGYHDGASGLAVIDRVVSSYTPSLWALLDTRRPADDTPGTPGSMLIASLRDTPLLPTLPHAEEEAALVAAHFPRALRLSGREATVAATRAALRDHTWAHFACHGDQGGLVLHDGRLGLDELADLAEPSPCGGRLAFLSACVTALPDTETLDEALHPAAAFLMNGYSHVIGTMWNIVSSDGPGLAAGFYAAVLDEGRAPALALHDAQLRLRAMAPDDPARWAPFLHIGI
jgi:CHAT domain-containing protein